MMPIILAFIAVLLIVSSVRGNTSQLMMQMSADAKGFLPLFVLIICAGAIGNFKTLRPLSSAILVLVIVSYTIMSGNQIITGLKAAA
jgi:hypothetical protein